MDYCVNEARSCNKPVFGNFHVIYNNKFRILRVQGLILGGLTYRGILQGAGYLVLGLQYQTQ